MNDIKPSNPFLRLKYRYLEWKWDKVLKKSHYTNWESYFIGNDPDFNYNGYTVKDQFCGYPYVALVSYKHLETTVDPFWGPIEHCKTIREWCKQNCRGKFRQHWERVVQDHASQYLPNGISGVDELFFGFKDYNDYIMFKLSWG